MTEDITILLGRKILLKIMEDDSTQILLQRGIIQKFVTVTNLCDETITSRIDNLLELERVFHSPIVILEKESLESGGRRQRTFSIGKWAFEETSPVTEEVLNGEGPRSKSSIRLLEKKDLDLLHAYNEHLLTIHTEIEKRIGFGILVNSHLFVCPHCEILMPPEPIAGQKCPYCHKEVQRGEMERIPIFLVQEDIKQIWTSNIWFEAYTAGLLRKLGWKTWIHVHVMGSSGVLHKVDILAIKDRTVLLGHCKTSSITEKDVNTFRTKITGLNVHISLLATTKELVVSEPETRTYFLNNPSIIRLENLGHSDETQIINDLEQRLDTLLKFRFRIQYS